MTDPVTPAEACADHECGHHPYSCDPWDALVSDLRAIDQGASVALAVFWRKEALARGLAADADAALANEARSIAAEVERYWDHGEDCPVWGAVDDHEIPSIDAESCDCGVGLLYRRIAALAAALRPEGGAA